MGDFQKLGIKSFLWRNSGRYVTMSVAPYKMADIKQNPENLISLMMIQWDEKKWTMIGKTVSPCGTNASDSPHYSDKLTV